MIARFAKWLSSWRPRASQDEFSDLSPEEREEVKKLRDAVEELNRAVNHTKRFVHRLSKVDPAILRAWRDHLAEQEKGNP